MAPWLIVALLAAILFTLVGGRPVARKAFWWVATIVFLIVGVLIFGGPGSTVAGFDLVESRRIVGVMEEERGLTDMQCDPALNRATIARSYWMSAPERTRPKIAMVIARVCLSDVGNTATLLRDERGATLHEVR